MRNRAKCRLCQEIIESLHRHDYVSCACGEISVDGGLDYLRAAAKDWGNFFRVDDLGNEIIVQVKESDQVEEPKEPPKPTLKDKIEMLKRMVEDLEKLPQNALTLPITHYDHLAALMLIYEILNEKVEKE